MVKINPSLMFSGTCGDAFRRYAALFSAKSFHVDLRRVAGQIRGAARLARCGSSHRQGGRQKAEALFGLLIDDLYGIRESRR